MQGRRAYAARQGAGKAEHSYRGVLEGYASAVPAASVFHFGIFTMREVKEYVRERGVEVRV